MPFTSIVSDTANNNNNNNNSSIEGDGDGSHVNINNNNGGGGGGGDEEKQLKKKKRQRQRRQKKGLSIPRKGNADGERREGETKEELEIEEGEGRLPAVVGIFHDLGKVGFPCNVPAAAAAATATVSTFVRNLRRTLRDQVLHCSQDMRIEKFSCYFDPQTTPDTMRQALASAGIDPICVSQHGRKDKDIVDKNIISHSVMFFADHLRGVDSGKVHRVVVLIVGDRNLSLLAQKLSQRSVKVVLVLQDRGQACNTLGTYHTLYMTDLLGMEDRHGVMSAASPTASIVPLSTLLADRQGRPAAAAAAPPPPSTNREMLPLTVENVCDVLSSSSSADSEPVEIVRLNALLMKAGVRPKGLREFLDKHPHLFTVERSDRGLTVRLTRHSRDLDSDEAIVEAILDVLSSHSNTWVPLSTVCEELSCQGLSTDHRDKVPNLVRAYPDYISLCGMGKSMEVALLKRLYQQV